MHTVSGSGKTSLRWLAGVALGLLAASEARAQAVTPTAAVISNGVYSTYFNMTGTNAGGGTFPVYAGTWSVAFAAGGTTGSADITYLNDGNQLTTNFNFFDVRVYNADGTTVDYSNKPYASGGPINLAPYLLASGVVTPATPNFVTDPPYFENYWWITDPTGQPVLALTQDVGIIGTTLGDSVVYETFMFENPNPSVPITVGLRVTRDFKNGTDDGPQCEVQTVTYGQAQTVTAVCSGHDDDDDSHDGCGGRDDSRGGCAQFVCTQPAGACGNSHPRQVQVFCSNPSRGGGSNGGSCGGGSNGGGSCGDGGSSCGGGSNGGGSTGGGSTGSGGATSTTIGPSSPTMNQFSYAPPTGEPTVVNVFSTAGGGPAYDMSLDFDPSSNPAIGLQNGWGLPTTPPDLYGFVDSVHANLLANAFTYRNVSSTATQVANVGATDGFDSAGLFWWGSTAGTAMTIDYGTQVFVTQAIFTPVAATAPTQGGGGSGGCDHDQHGCDQHGCDQHGCDQHGCDQHGCDQHGCDEHGGDQHAGGGSRDGSSSCRR